MVVFIKLTATRALKHDFVRRAHNQITKLQSYYKKEAQKNQQEFFAFCTAQLKANAAFEFVVDDIIDDFFIWLDIQLDIGNLLSFSS